jgi:hypothetical protein
MVPDHQPPFGERPQFLVHNLLAIIEATHLEDEQILSSFTAIRFMGQIPEMLDLLEYRLETKPFDVVNFVGYPPHAGCAEMALCSL